MSGVELLPREYGLVIVVVVAYCFLNLWMAATVGKSRLKYNVPYPAMYALESENKDAKLFNCIQDQFTPLIIPQNIWFWQLMALSLAAFLFLV